MLVLRVSTEPSSYVIGRPTDWATDHRAGWLSRIDMLMPSWLYEACERRPYKPPVSKSPTTDGPALTSGYAGDLYHIYAQLRVETLLFSRNPDTERQLEDWSSHDLYDREARRSNYWKRTVQLFTVPRNRRAALAACLVMASQ